LAGLKWRFSDQGTPSAGRILANSSGVATTDGAGVLSVTVKTTLSSGGIGWLEVTDSDGTTGQNPPALAFSGPVTVA
jgi:hypothetical protein